MTDTDTQILLADYAATQQALHNHLLPLLKDYHLLRRELYGKVDQNLIDSLPDAVFYSTGSQDFTFLIEDYEDSKGSYTEFYPVYLPFSFTDNPEGYKERQRKSHEALKASKAAQERLKSQNRVKLLKSELAKEEAKLGENP